MQMRKFSPRRVNNNKRKGLFLKEAEKNLAICYFFKQSSGHISCQFSSFNDEKQDTSIEIKEATIVAMMFDLMIPRYQEEYKMITNCDIFVLTNKKYLILGN